MAEVAHCVMVKHGVLCAKRARWRLWYSCPHDHVANQTLCDSCAAFCMEMKWKCKPCRLNPVLPHSCPATFIKHEPLG